MTNFVIKIYKDDLFVGYIKNIRVHRNRQYRFIKTKNIDKCMKYKTECYIKHVIAKISNQLDISHYYKSSYKFESKLITNQEIRLSKLNVLDKKIIRMGIFKNKIL